MAIPIDGGVVQYRKPGLPGKSGGLGEKLEKSLQRFLVGVIQDNDETLSRLLSYAGEQFLGGLESDLTSIAEPILGYLVSLEGIPGNIKDTLNRLRYPESPVAGVVVAAILGLLISGFGGAVMAPISTYVAQQIARGVETNIPPPEALYDMVRRGGLSLGNAERLLDRSGIEGGLYGPWREISRPQIGIGDILEAYRRGDIDWSGRVLDLLSKQGIRIEDFGIYQSISKTLLDTGSIITGFRRDRIPYPDAHKRLTQLGHPAGDADLILDIQEPIPAAQDLILMAVREAWRDDIAQKWGYDADFPAPFQEWMSRLGYNPDWAKRYWRAHWALPSVTLGYEMMHRRIISEGELDTLLKIADYPSVWRGRMIQAAYTPLTRVDVRRMYGLGVLNEDEVYWSYRDIGYNELNARRMTDFTKLYVNKDDGGPLYEARELTRSVIEKAYRKRVITRPEAETRLAAIPYSHEDIDLLLSMVDIQIELESIPDYLADYQKDLQKIVLRSYTNRLIGEAKATEYLLTVGLTETEIGLQLAIADFLYSEAVRDKELSIIGEAYTKRAVERTTAIGLLGRLALPATQQSQVLSEWETERELRTRRLTEAQYRKALKDGIIGVGDYSENLRGLGYTEMDIVILVKMAAPKSEGE